MNETLKSIFRRRRIAWITSLALVLGALPALVAGPDHNVRVTFFDIGQGDAIHIRAADGIDVLIDGGPSERFVQLLASDMPATDRTIELVILTHPDYDHLAGLLSLFDRFHIERVLTTRAESMTQTFRRWQEAVRSHDVPVSFVTAPEKRTLPNATLSILWPTEAMDTTNRPLNEHSVVVRLDTAGQCALFTGDAPAAVEHELGPTDIRCDVLKVGHHGSASSSSETFLRAVQPDYAVISVGAKNRYGHPAPSVLARLGQYAGKILRTDRLGTVTMIFLEEGIVVKTEKKESRS